MLNSLRGILRNFKGSYTIHKKGYAYHSEYAEKINYYIHKTFMQPIKEKENLIQLVKRFTEEFDKSLKDPTAKGASLSMTNTFVKHLATGTEKGKYLAISIQGEEIVLMLCHIYDGWLKRVARTFRLNDFQKKEFSSDMLVAMVAEQAMHFIANMDVEALGEAAVTCPANFFSPTALDRAIIKPSGLEINKLLTSFLATFGYRIDIKAIVSDSAATFVDSQWFRPLTKGAIETDDQIRILHLENTEDVNRWSEQKEDDLLVGPNTLVMTDLSEFGENGELDAISTEYDNTLDKQSGIPSQKRFYKMTSPWHVGELVRIVLESLVRENVIFHGKLTPGLKTSGIITNKDVALFESMDRNDEKIAEIVNTKLQYKKYETADIFIIKGVCKAVIERACRLIAAAIAGLSMRYPENVIGFTAHGVLYDTHSYIDYFIDQYVNDSIHPPTKIVKVMKRSETAHLRGAALLAARLTTLNRTNHQL